MISRPPSMVRGQVPIEMLCVGAILAFVGLVVSVVPSEEWGGLLVYLLVVIVAGLILYQWGIKPVDRDFPAPLFVLALAAKLVGSMVRYWTVVGLYDLAADALIYHWAGQYLGPYFGRLDFSVLANYSVRSGETTTLAIFTGGLYSVLPDNTLAGGFLFFAGLAFAGSIFFYRAVRVAWPEAKTGWYRLLIFFLPSILFWPASMGKDAFVMFATGFTALGWAHLVRRGQLFGLVAAIAGLLLVNLIRAPVAALLAVSMAGGFLFGAVRAGRGAFTWLVGLVVVGVLGFYLMQSGAKFLAMEDLSLTSAQEAYDYQRAQTYRGGSRFEAGSVFNPLLAVAGMVSALVRPFPWEAHNAQVLIASLETVGWLVMMWRRRGVFRERLRSLTSDPMASCALIFSLAMLLGLTSIANFGILARQRVQLLPFLWMLFV